jgi:hypothetical protein
MRLLLAGGTPTIVLGPFVDDADGKTAETGLTIAQAAVRLSKNGGAFAQKSDASACTHMEAGYYACPLNATDLNAAGVLTVAVAASGALPVRQDYTVLLAAAYNALVAGTGNGIRGDIAAINGSTSGAARLALGANAAVPGTVDTTAFTPSATAFECDDITTAAADVYNGRILLITSGTYAGTATTITDYALVSGRGRFTVDSLGSNVPANDVTILIL